MCFGDCIDDCVEVVVYVDVEWFDCDWVCCELVGEFVVDLVEVV